VRKHVFQILGEAAGIRTRREEAENGVERVLRRNSAAIRSGKTAKYYD
jgi:hypothetical protein